MRQIITSAIAGAFEVIKGLISRRPYTTAGIFAGTVLLILFVTALSSPAPAYGTSDFSVEMRYDYADGTYLVVYADDKVSCVDAELYPSPQSLADEISADVAYSGSIHLPTMDNPTPGAIIALSDEDFLVYTYDPYDGICLVAYGGKETPA